MLGSVLAAVVLTTGVIYGSAALARKDHRALAPTPGLEDLSVPDFTLTTQDGRSFTREDFINRLTVVNFIFTNCPFICPTLTQKMKTLQTNVGSLGVRLVSISVDPTHDTPETLRAYAQRLGADPAVWTFLTGDFETARAISEGGLRLALSIDRTRPITLGDGTVMNNVAHTGKLVLIGPDARVIGMYSGLDAADVQRLEQRIRLAVRALPR